MKPIRPYLPLLAAIAATAVAGVLHGRLSYRWGGTAAVAQLSQRLEAFPEQFAAWQLAESYEIEPEVIRMLQCQGYLNRRYVNRDTGASAHVAVTLGPAGPTAVHSPEVCYSSREFRILKNRTPQTIRDAAGDTSTVWSVAFESRGVDQDLLLVYYGWTTDGVWQAAENPRFDFAGQPHLMKIQLAVSLPAGTTLNDENPCKSFLQDFIPALKEFVFRTSENPETPTLE
jgi:hypothetical protein